MAVLQEIVDSNQVAKPDVWTERLVTLPTAAAGKLVVVGIWDSGTDVAIFQPAAVKGIAFDEDMRPTDPLVRPMGAAEARMAVLKQYMKGVMDLRAAIDSPDARALKQRISTLKQDEVQQFSEDLSALGKWARGTHVAGIAVETFKKAGARVVNMSWRYGPAFHEAALAYHNVGKTPEERKQIANKLFGIEKQALEDSRISPISGACTQCCWTLDMKGPGVRRGCRTDPSGGAEGLS